MFRLIWPAVLPVNELDWSIGRPRQSRRTICWLPDWNCAALGDGLGSAVSHPTRCDVLLYPPSISPPVNDSACQDDTPGVTSYEFVPGAGATSGLIEGYALGVVRLELEYLNASLASDESPIVSSTSTALQSKDSEWSTDLPPFARIGQYYVHHVFASVLWHYRFVSRWTPFAGAGVG